ncbi:hypothetical protein [Methanimicrococcus hongohii]|uniref:hypothetical protein n=1 Tax=Methanimicrococcus hongohii TaxID=3028295 RepID=UPI002930FE4E|nr:hypothetical protein [Methanimicrococcus sp. Hf6]
MLPLLLAVTFTAANQVCVAVCICSFLSNPFAFANVPPLPSGLHRRPTAATIRRRARAASFFNYFFQKTLSHFSIIFLKIALSFFNSFSKSISHFLLNSM